MKLSLQFLKESGIQLIGCTEKIQESIYEVDYADPDVDLDKLTGRGQYAPGGDSYTDSTLYKAWDEPGEEKERQYPLRGQ